MSFDSLREPATTLQSIFNRVAALRTSLRHDSNTATTKARPGRRSHFLTGSNAWVLITAISLLLVSVSGAQAQNLCDPCVIRLARNTTEASIPLKGDGSGWLAPSDAKSTTVLEAPTHGTWQNEIYTPGDTFWSAGADQLVVNVETWSGVDEGPRTLILLAEDPVINYEQFLDLNTVSDPAQVPGWTQYGGQAMRVETSYTGGSGPTLVMTAQEGQNPEPSMLAGPDHHGVLTENVLGGEAIASPDSGGDITHWLNVTILDVDGMIFVETRIEIVNNKPQYQARAYLDENDFVGCDPCTTPWLIVDDDLEVDDIPGLTGFLPLQGGSRPTGARPPVLRHVVPALLDQP